MKIIKNQKNYGSTQADKQFFIDNYDKIKPLKQITVYFDCENFLLTKYDVDNGTTFVAESWNGNQMHLTGLNCGYGGTAPSGTAYILEMLGIGREEAFNLKYYPSIKVNFDKSGKYTNYEVTKNVFFSHQGEYSKKCHVYIDENMHFEFETRKLYFINPQYYSPVALYNAINIADLYQVQYYIGKNSPLDKGYIPNIEHVSSKKCLKDSVSGVNLILYGQNFDIIVLIDRKMSRSVVNNIYSYIFKESLFDDEIYYSKPEYGIKAFLFGILLESQEIYGTKKIHKENRKWTGKIF